MKIAIISDIHDNLEDLNMCLKWCRENSIDEIICCGDVTNSETLRTMAKNFKGRVSLVKGNVELYDEKEIEKYKNIELFGKIGVVNIEKIAIGFCHEPFLIDKVKEREKCDYIFYGHTHKPWIEEDDSTKIVNPGTLGGVFQKATFAFLDLDSRKLELKLLENL